MADIQKIFPDDLLSNKEKDDYKFGTEVAEVIDTHWFDGNLELRRHWIDLMRSYSRGEQDIQQYKDTIEGSRDKTNENASDFQMKTHKIDYKLLKIMPVFKGIVTNAIDESLFKPRAEAIDITAVNKKKAYFKKLEDDFYTKDFSDLIGQSIGVNLTPQKLPANEKELGIKKIEYKPRIEIAQELAIENVLKHQKFETVKNKVDEDLFDLGIGVVHHWTDRSRGIILEYVDPYNFIHNDFEYDDGRDIRYAGVMKEGTIADVEKESGRTLKQEELDGIKKYSMSYNGISDAFTPYNHAQDGGRTLEYLSFAYLTRKERIFKKLRGKNKTARLIDRSENGYNPENKSKRIDIPYKVWYEGVWIPSARILTKWQEIPNQIEDDLENPIAPFLVTAPNVKKLSEKGHVRFDSLINRVIPIIDDIHRDWFKFQQLKMELRPNTIEIDTDAINEVTLNGQTISPQDLLDLFFGRGLLLKKGFNEDGDEIARAVTETDGGLNNTALQFLTNEFANNLGRLRQFLGINEVRDGTTTPNSKTAVTVQKLLLASSNTATNHIVRSSFELSLNICESISYRLSDVLKSEALKERYMSIIGSSNVDLLDEIKQLPMHTFGIYFDFKPDNEERIAFEQSLIDARQQGEINTAQYNKARQVRNVKSAIKYLEFSIEENQKRAQREKLEVIREQAEANGQNVVVQEKAKQQTNAQEQDSKLLMLREKDKIEERKEKRKALLEELRDQKKHERAIEIQSMSLNQKSEIENNREDRKDARVNLQDTNESKKIFQRKNNTDPIDFKRELDSIFDTL